MRHPRLITALLTLTAALLDDNGADSTVYFVASNGTSWWYAAMTKAT